MGVVFECGGTGKSLVIAWVQRLFVDVLGWTSGVQFMCLAFQNTMAGSIGGATVHSWAGISFKGSGGQQGAAPKYVSELFNRCQSLRWLLIDEISMLSSELTAELQRRVCEALRHAAAR